MRTIISEKRLRAMLDQMLIESDDLQLLAVQQQLAKKEPEHAVGTADNSTYYCETSMSPGNPVTAFPMKSTDYILEFLNSLGSGGTEIGDAFESITNDSESLNEQILSAFKILDGDFNIINSNNIDNNSPFSDLLVGVSDNNPDNFPTPNVDIKLRNSNYSETLPTVDASSFYLVSLKATAANKGKSGFYDPVGNSSIHPHTIPQALLGLTKKIKESAPTSSGNINYKRAAANIGSPPVFDEEGNQTGGGIHDSKYKMKYRIGALTCEPAALFKDGINLPPSPTPDEIDDYLKNTFVGAKIVGSFLPDVLEAILDYSKIDLSDKGRKEYAEEVLQPQVDSFNELSQIIVKNIFALYQEREPKNARQHKAAMTYVRSNIINDLAATALEVSDVKGMAGYTTPEARERFLNHRQLIASMKGYVDFITADSKFPYVRASSSSNTFMGAAFNLDKLIKSNKAFVAADGSIRSKTAWERYLDGFNLIRSYFGGPKSPLQSLKQSEDALPKLSLRDTQTTGLSLVRENFEFYLVYKSLYEYASIATSSDTTASAAFLNNLGLSATDPKFSTILQRMQVLKSSSDAAISDISGDIQEIKNSLKELGSVIAQAIQTVYNDSGKSVSDLKNIIVNGINNLIQQIRDFTNNNDGPVNESFLRDVISAGQSLLSFVGLLRKTISMINEQDFNVSVYNNMVANLNISVSPEIEKRITAGINNLISVIKSNLSLQEDRKLYNNILQDIMEAAAKKRKSVKRK